MIKRDRGTPALLLAAFVELCEVVRALLSGKSDKVASDLGASRGRRFRNDGPTASQ